MYDGVGQLRMPLRFTAALSLVTSGVLKLDDCSVDFEYGKLQV